MKSVHQSGSFFRIQTTKLVEWKQSSAFLDGFHSPSALEAIALQSRGWPCVINTLATTCLLYGHQLKKDVIDEEVVRMAAEEMGY
ncbi:hypothetical protein GT50_14700 [Geobacillus stearothermophilus 10]|nr:hypothetical protein GT50_14700 [Geobacillus stearothermophilus 10]